MNNTYTSENTTSRHELLSLVNSLRQEQLIQLLDSGWTVSGILAHLAFWDQRALTLLQKWQHEGIGPSPVDVDVINEVTRPLCIALESRTAAQLAISTAEAIDKAIESLTPEFIARVETDGKTVRLNRASHRHEHLTQIKQALNI
jgi:hypothetical protein